MKLSPPRATRVAVPSIPLAEVAAITMGRDMSIRELQQGAWRMRGLARGQTLEMTLGFKLLLESLQAL